MKDNLFFLDWLKSKGWVWNDKKYHFFKMIKDKYFRNEPAEMFVIEEYTSSHLPKIRIFNGSGDTIYAGNLPENERNAACILRHLNLS